MILWVGGWCHQHRRTVLISWVIVAVASLGLAGAAGSAFDGTFEIPASESADGFALLDEYFPGEGTSLTGSIVFATEDGVDDPEVRSSMEEMFDRVDDLDGVSVFSPYGERGAGQIAPSREIAIATVNLAADTDQAEASVLGLEIAALAPEVEGLTVEIGGDVLAEFAPPESELIGIAFAIFVLIVAFGSVLSMGLPISVAVFGVLTGIGSVALLSHVTSVPEFATAVGAMIGLGVGIDYALFIVTRYREGVLQGMTGEESIRVAMDTAGRAVAFAGLTVVVSLLGMLLMGLAFISGLGITAAIVVAITMLASLTLLPAMIGFAGDRMEITRWRGLLVAGALAVALFGMGIGFPMVAVIGLAVAGLVLLASLAVEPLTRRVPNRRHKPMRRTLAYRWSRLVQAHPWLSILVGGGILIGLTIPVLSINLGFSDAGNFPPETTTRRAYDLIADGFGPGFNGPLILAVEVGDPTALPSAIGLLAAIEADPGVVGVSEPFPSDLANPMASPAYLVQIIPTTSPQDPVTEETVKRLRAQVIAPVLAETDLEAHITGVVPASIDFTEYLARRMFLFFGVVLALSFVLLMLVFRSLLVPLKAVIMNMLSISAAYGVVVAIFQWGWFASVFGVEPAPIDPFIPMMLFAIVFGLSMDYEVFLLSRIKEEFDRTGDAANSVANGLASTARVITAAAAIMVVVFGSFLLEDQRVIKLMGTGLALAVLLDASLVRLLLVPAAMELMGERNWWIPRWLDRILPNISVEGSSSRPSEVDGLEEEEPREKWSKEPPSVPDYSSKRSSSSAG